MTSLNRFWAKLFLVSCLIGGIFHFSLSAGSAYKPVSIGCIENRVIGHSVNGKEITLCHVGGSNSKSKNSILAIGSIHGNELAGIAVVDQVIRQGALENDLWVIRMSNPDGAIAYQRKNANGVDINRNFPTKWLPSDPSLGTYSGTSPASEPETRTLMQIISELKPRAVITFHQPFGLIDCAYERDNTLSLRLAELTGLPTQCIPGEKSGSDTNTYTGTISIWVNSSFPETTALAFEIGKHPTAAEINRYAEALRRL